MLDSCLSQLQWKLGPAGDIMIPESSLEMTAQAHNNADGQLYQHTPSHAAMPVAQAVRASVQYQYLTCWKLRGAGVGSQVALCVPGECIVHFHSRDGDVATGVLQTPIFMEVQGVGDIAERFMPSQVASRHRTQ